MTPGQFINHLKALDLPDTFNPYRDHCRQFDRYDAAKQRRRVLKRTLESARESTLESIWLGRDLGYRGGRRTGLALTDDCHLRRHTRRWGFECNRMTKGEPVSERTAQVIWPLLDDIKKPVFLWNVFPLHPHEPANPFSNRSHTAAERQVGEQLLVQLIQLLQPQRLIAIGNHAASSAEKIASAASIHRVRHPSYGGQRDFINAICKLYKLPANRYHSSKQR